MKVVVLINPPNHNADRFDLAPPLGLMVLAKIARDVGWHPVIVDFNLHNECVNEPAAFYEHGSRQILDARPTVVCFTSMGVNSHVSLELARYVKEADQSIVTCIGGIHFTSVAEKIKTQCSWIDTIILGEGEQAFRRFLQQLDPFGSYRDLPLLVNQSRSSEGIAHPHSSYDLIVLEDYFAANPRRLVNYEGGRGCIFKCSFCYSPSHYESVRDVQPEQVATDWAILADRGIQHVFMIQDNFTNYPKSAIAICNALAAASLPITWNGYATLPQLSLEVIKALGRSRCKQIYLGVDAVSAVQQVTFNKRFYRGNALLEDCLRALKDEGVEPTCAFMLDLFNYNENEAEVIFRVAASCTAAGASIRLNTFTRYPNSGLSLECFGAARYSEARIRIMLDCPLVVRQNPFVRAIPSAFPFHETEVEDEGIWVNRLQMVWLAQRLIQSYPDDFNEMVASSHNNVIVDGLRRILTDRISLDFSEFDAVLSSLEPSAEIY